MKRKNANFTAILQSASDACAQLMQLEKENCVDVDLLARVCAEGIACSCTVGLSGDARRLMTTAASGMGRLVYLLDACDDLKTDSKKGSFNPFLLKYGSVEKAQEQFEIINATLALYARELDLVVDLIVRPNRYDGICKNITQKGIPAAIRRVCTALNDPDLQERK